MNLQKLFEMQRKLDQHIEREHPRQEGEDRLAKKILALMVELGELANEARFFKYWSHDQKPRTEVKISCRFCSGEGKGYFAGHQYTGRKETCIHCGGTGIEEIKNRLLEEYVDCLHFILSIGLELGITDVAIDSDYTHEDPTITFIHLFSDAWELLEPCCPDRWDEWDRKEIYEIMFNRFIGLGEKHLGFTWEQIEEAYLQKNAENHARQERGY
jgi:dimeric dUTPase (all-alpha-NTP-PPase superfamily)